MRKATDDLSLGLACQTPLPRSTGTVEAPTTRPYTRSQAKAEQQNRDCHSPLLEALISSRKRARKSKVDVFVDTNVLKTAGAPTPKKLKPNERIALRIKTDFINTTPVPSPRYPDTPFPFSPSDPLWEDIENYDSQSLFLTPPPTPDHATPTSPSSPFASTNSSTRVASRHHVLVTSALPPPKDKSLYDTLKLDDWRATREEIIAAYRKIAVSHHPDKVAEEGREHATRTMQAVNAAKEILLDSKRRAAYHKSGELPWSSLTQA